MATVSSAPRTTTFTTVSTTAGPFNITFRLFDTDSLDVYLSGVRTTAFTVNASFSNGFTDDATVTLNTPVSSGTQIIIDGALTPQRATTYLAAEPQLTAKLNIELARIWSGLSEVKRDSERAVRGFSAIDPTENALEAVEDATAAAAAAAASAEQAAAYAAATGSAFGVPVETYGAVGDGVTDDRAAFIAAEASGFSPILLSQDYYLSSNTGGTAGVYDLGGNATVTMGAGTFQPSRYTENKAKTYRQRVNFTATNPASGDPGAYSLLDTGYIDQQYLINQWGAQNMVTQTSGFRTGAYAQRYQMLHSGEGDGYCTFWSTGVTAHSRIGLATHFAGQSSGGLGGGQTNALSDKVNLYGFGDVVVHDNGYEDVAIYNYVGIVYFNGTDSGDYSVPRLGMFQLNAGTNSIDANFLAGGPTKIAFDATKADVDWGAFVMKAGQKILFDATESATAGKFAATAAGSYYMMKSPTTTAIVVGRGADDADVFRVEGASATARLSMGAAGTISYIAAHTTGSDSTTLSLRTYNAGAVGDRLVIGPTGNVNLATASARFQMNGVNVLNARQTGWTAATGTATRTTFATGSVTTAQLAERVKALIDDLITHGLIGA
jgi:hypothetical protein